MNKLRRLLTTVGLGATLFIGNGFADTILQTFTFGPSISDVGAGATAHTFNFFGSAGAPSGATLTGVTLAVTLHDAVTQMDVQNSTGISQAYTEQLFVQYLLGGTAPDLAAITAGGGAGGVGGGAAGVHDIYTIGRTFPPPTITETIASGVGAEQCWVGPCGVLAQGAGLTLADYTNFANLGGATGDGLWNSGTINGTTASYAGSGTFTINYASFTQQTNSSGANFNPIDQSGATYTVIYTYTPFSGTPEPATMVLMGSALLGLGFIRRRKA